RVPAGTVEHVSQEQAADDDVGVGIVVVLRHGGGDSPARGLLSRRRADHRGIEDECGVFHVDRSRLAVAGPRRRLDRTSVPTEGAVMYRFRATFLLILLTGAAATAAAPKRDALWAAVRAGDAAAVRAAVAAGADVNARNEYGVTALWIAAGKD